MERQLSCSFLAKLLPLWIVMFFMSFSMNAQTPACNEMRTPNFITCANDVILYTSNINAAGNGKAITWTITDIASGAYFVESGTQILHKVATGSDPAGSPNTVAVNVGPDAGSLTVLLTFDGAGLQGSCSSSRIVKVVKVIANAPPINCFGAKTVITASATTQDTKGGPFFPNPPYQYTLTPGNIVNNTGVFADVAPGDYVVEAREGVNGLGCGAKANVHIDAVADRPIILHCPNDFEASACAFVDQAAVDAAFKTFLDGFTFEGGTAPIEEKFEPALPLAPALCNGQPVVVKYIVKDACGREESCTKTFKINAPPPVIHNEPAEKHIKSCDPQVIADAYAQFLAQFTIGGGCNPQKVGEAPAVPNLCGGQALVKYVIKDKCLVDIPVQGLFVVDAPDTVTYNKPQDKVMDACDQAAVDLAYKAFLEGFTVGGGCAPKLVGVAPQAPAYCGGEVEVCFNIEDKCLLEPIRLCAKFKVNDAKAPLITQCVADKDLKCNPAVIDGPGVPVVNSVCDYKLTTDVKDTNIGCDFKRTIVYTVTNGCQMKDECTQVITWKEDKSVPVITLIGPAIINLPDLNPTEAAILAALGNATATDDCHATVTFTDSPRNVVDCLVTVTRTFHAINDCGIVAADVQRVVTFKVSGCENFNGCTLGYWKNHTLAWNIYTTCTLYKDVFSGSTMPANLTLLQALNLGGNSNCENLARQSVAALLNITEGLPYHIGSVSALQDVVNKAFAEGNCNAVGAQLDAFNNEGGANHCNVEKSPNDKRDQCNNAKKMIESIEQPKPVKVYPNPFRGSVNFDLFSPEAGRANLEIFNVIGQRVAIPYDGHIGANETIKGLNVSLNTGSGIYIYRFSVNGESKHVGRIFGKD